MRMEASLAVFALPPKKFNAVVLVPLTPKVWLKPAPTVSRADRLAALPIVIEALVAKGLLAPMRKMPDCKSVVPVHALVPESVKTPVPTLRMALPAAAPAPRVPEKVVEMLLPPTIKVLDEVPLFSTVPAPASAPMVVVRLPVVSKISNVPLAPMVTGLVPLLTLTPAAPLTVPALMNSGPVKVELAPMMIVPAPVLV